MAWYNDAWNATGGKAIDFIDPATGHKRAGAAGRQAGQDFRNLGQDQWNRQMTGLNGAMGQWDTARGAMDYFSGQMANPGHGERAWQEYGSQFFQPPSTTGMTDRMGPQYRDMSRGMQQMAGQFGGQLQGQSNSQGMFDQFRNPGETQSMQQYRYGSSAMERPGSTENFYATMGNQLGRPSETQQAYATMDFGKAGQGVEDRYKSLARQFEARKGAATSAAERNQILLEEAQGRLDADHNAIVGELGNRGGVAQYENEAGGYMRGANALQGFMGRQGNQFETEGDFERFAGDFARTGTNAYYDRAEKQGLAKLNQEMARRGSFRSGGANAAIGNYLGETESQRAKAIGDTLAQGQQMKMQRLGQGAGLAQGVSSERMGQGQALQGLGVAKSQEQIGRTGARNAAQQTKNQQFNALLGQRLQAGQAASQEELARAGMMNDMADKSGARQLQAMQAQMAAAGQTDSTGLQRLMSRFGMAQGSDQALGNRMDYLQRGAGQADSSTATQRQLQAMLAGQSDNQLLQRLQGAFGMQQGANAQTMGLDQQMLQALQGQDDFRLRGLSAGLQGANTAQGMAQNRMGGVVDREMAMAGQRAGLYGNMYTQGNQMYGDAMNSGINAELWGAGQDAMGFNMRQQAMGELLKSLVPALGQRAQAQGSAGGGQAGLLKLLGIG